jgi:hypothetical protein
MMVALHDQLDVRKLQLKPGETVIGKGSAMADAGEYLTGSGSP